MELSVVIVSYNAGELMGSCLKVLLNDAESSKLSIEVIVVDNASEDNTLSYITRHFPRVTPIANSVNKGFATATNQGLARAIGRYLLLLNPDAVVHPGALNTMISFMETNPNVGIIGPRTFDHKGAVALTARASYCASHIIWNRLQLNRLFPYRVTGKYRAATEQANAPFEVSWVAGSCFMIRRETYQAIGGLDEDFFLFAEEPDYCDRAMQAGWRTVYHPNAHVIHQESTTISKYPDLKIRHYHISPLHYFRKRHDRRSIRLLKIGFTLELLIKFIIRRLQLIRNSDDDLTIRAHTYRTLIREIWRYKL